MKSAKSYRIMQFTLEELCLGGQTRNGKLRLNAETLKSLLFPKVKFTDRSKLSRDMKAIEYASKAAITIPYNAALRQIYLLREEAGLREEEDSKTKEKGLRTRADILQSAYTGPSNNDYFLQDILYVDLNVQSGIGGKDRVDLLLNGLIIEFDGKPKTKKNSESQTSDQAEQEAEETTEDCGRYEIEYVVFERSASQQRQNMLVMIRKDQFEQNLAEDADALESRIRCGIPADHTCIISKYSAYRALMLTSGICMDAGEYLKQDSILVVKDYQIKHWRELCKKYDLLLDTSDKKRCATVKHDKGEKDSYIRDIEYISEDKEVQEDKLFDGEGLISPDFGKYISNAILEGRGNRASSYQIRMPFVKGVVHTVDFRSILKEIFPDKELKDIKIRDAFSRERSVEKVHMILTVSMFKMYFTYLNNAKGRADDSAKNGTNESVQVKDGFADYWESYIKGEHRLFVSGCDEVFRGAPEFTISNYQFLSTLEESAADGQDRQLALIAPSVNAVWTTTQSSDSQAISYVLRSRIPVNLLESGGNEEDQKDPTEIEKKRMQEHVSDAKLLYHCPQLAHTFLFREKMKRDHLAADLSIGHLIQPGTMRYLSGDLLQFCCLLADNALNCEKGKNKRKNKGKTIEPTNDILKQWMLEAADGVVPLHTERDGLGRLFTPYEDGKYRRLIKFMNAVIAEKDEWDDAKASRGELALFQRMKHAFLSRKAGSELDLKKLLSSEEFTTETTQLERRKAFNKWLLEADISGAAYYAPGAPRKRAVIDRNPHLARNEHVVLDPLAEGELRKKYFRKLKGIVMLRVERDQNVQRLGGADFDGDIVRLFYDPAYIAAAEKSCTLPPLVIPGVNAKEQTYDAEARCELVRRSSGSRVGSFSNLAFRTSLLAYCHRTGYCPEEEEYKKKKSQKGKSKKNEEDAPKPVEDSRSCAEKAECNLVKLSCMVGMEIDAVKTNKKPDYVREDMSVYQCYPGIAWNYDPAKINYFLSYKDRVKKRRGTGKVEFDPMPEEIGHYSLVEHLPYIFNPQLLDDIRAIPEKKGKDDAEQKSRWAKQCHQLLWEEADGKKYQHRTDPLTAYQPEHKYLYQIVGSLAAEQELAPELRAAFCAASAKEQLEQRNYVESSTSAKIHTIRRLLAVYLGMNAGSLMAAKVEEFVGNFKNERQVLEMIFKLLPWGSYPNAELRRTHFNMLCKEKGLDFHTNKDDDLDSLCCNLNLYVTDHDQLLRILLEHSEAELLGEERTEKVNGKNKKVRQFVPDIAPQIIGSLPDGFEQKRLTDLRNAFWECNTMYALRRTAEAIQRIDETSKYFPSFRSLADAYGLRVPEEDTLLEALTKIWDADARRNLCSALTTFPSARKQVEKIFYEMIRENRRITENTEKSQEADMRMLGCIPGNTAEERKLASLWRQFERLCKKLHSAKVSGEDTSTDECLRKMAKEICSPREIDWLSADDAEKREEFAGTKLFSEEIWTLLDEQEALRNLICDPQCWQLLPAILNYARSVSATNARQENRRQFEEETKAIFYPDMFPYAVACRQKSGERNDLVRAVQEVVEAYQNIGAKTTEEDISKIAAADTKQTIELLVDWAYMPQGSVMVQGDMVVFSRNQLNEAQQAEAERRGSQVKDTDDEEEDISENKNSRGGKKTNASAKDKAIADKLKIDKLTADLFRLLQSCGIDGLKRRDMVRTMFDAIYTKLNGTSETAPAQDAEDELDDEAKKKTEAELARRKQIFQILIAAEKYAAMHPIKSKEKTAALQRFICNYYAECLYAALPSANEIIHVKNFRPNYECGFVDGCQGIALNAAEENLKKYRDFSSSITITTKIGGASGNLKEILKENIKLPKENAPAMTIELLEPELTADSAGMLWLYSIPFEIRAGEEQVLTGALTHLRLPQVKEKTDQNYADLAKQPLTLEAVIRCDAKGKVTVSEASGRRYSEKLEVKQPLDSFVWGYRKYRRNAGTDTADAGKDTVKEDANND